MKKDESTLSRWDKNLQLQEILSIDDTDIVLQIFKAHFPSEYVEKYYFNMGFSQTIKSFPKPVYSDPYIVNDTVYLISSIYYLKTKDTIDGLLSLLKIKDGKLISVTKITLFTSNSDYVVRGSDYYRYKNEEYIAVKRKAISTNNAVLGKLKNENDVLALKEIAPFYLSERHTKDGYGYNFVSLIKRQRYINHRYYPFIYDFDSQKTVELPIHLETDIDTNHKTSIGLKSRILDIYVDGNVFDIIYVSNDSLYHAHCLAENNKIVLESTKLIVHHFKEKKVYHVLADKNGYYLYFKEYGILSYTKYS